MSDSVELSVVVPVFDEEESLPVLHGELLRALERTGRTFEVLYVDDHSRDGSLGVLLDFWRSDGRVRVITFRRNCGQTSALAAGFDHARGELVITLDADLQNDPADIPAMLDEIERGFDFVVGWRKKRQDGFILRRVPSIVANRLIGRVTGVRIHDTGCTLKVMRREVVKSHPIYAEQHRFLPAMSRQSGARVSEIVVNHRPRRFGRSKYGIGRTFRVLSDLFTVKMIASFTRHPGQYFGLLSLPFALTSAFFLATALANLSLMSFSSRWAQSVMLCSMLFGTLCVYFLLLGLLAELAVKASGVHRRRVLEAILTTPLDG